MENTFSVKMIFHFYHSVVKAELKRRGFPKEVAKKIEEEHGKIVARAKDIGKSKLLSSYIMASYYIAMNRSTGKSAEENYEIFRDGLCASKLFRRSGSGAECCFTAVCGNVQFYHQHGTAVAGISVSGERLWRKDGVYQRSDVCGTVCGRKAVSHVRTAD